MNGFVHLQVDQQTSMTKRGVTGHQWSLMNSYRTLMEKFVKNRRLSISEFPINVHIFPGLFYMTGKLGTRKFSARWMPNILPHHHRNQRMASAVNFLNRYDEKVEPLPNRIVTGGKTCIKNVNPESQEHSMGWCHKIYLTNHSKIPGRFFWLETYVNCVLEC